MHPSPILCGIAIFRTLLFEEYLPFSFTLRIPPLAHVTRLVHKIGLPSSPLASPMRSLRPRPACLATKTSSTAMPAASLPSYLTQWPAPRRLRCQRPTLRVLISLLYLVDLVSRVVRLLRICQGQKSSQLKVGIWKLHIGDCWESLEITRIRLPSSPL